MVTLEALAEVVELEDAVLVLQGFKGLSVHGR